MTSRFWPFVKLMRKEKDKIIKPLKFDLQFSVGDEQKMCKTFSSTVRAKLTVLLCPSFNKRPKLRLCFFFITWAHFSNEFSLNQRGRANVRRKLSGIYLCFWSETSIYSNPVFKRNIAHPFFEHKETAKQLPSTQICFWDFIRCTHWVCNILTVLM